jgi:hypothetical protein
VVHRTGFSSHPCLSNSKQGTGLADVIVNKIKEAVDNVAFR